MKTIILFTLIMLYATLKPSAQQWDTLANIPAGLTFPVVVSLNNDIHVMGGGGPSGATDLHLRYDPGTNSWDTLAPVPYLAQQPTGAVLNGRIHYFGGGYPNSGTPLDSHYWYDPVIDSWSSAAPLPVPRVIMEAAAFGGKLYAMGGQPDKDRMDVYNPVTNSWKQLNNLPDDHYWYSSLVIYNDQLYRFGGGSFSAPVTTVGKYDTAQDAWSTVSQLPKAMHAPAATALDNKIYITGGYNFSELDVSYIFDPGNPSYKTTYSLPAARSYHDMVTIDSCIYVVGGNNNSQTGIKTSLLRLCNPPEVTSMIEKGWLTMALFPNPVRNRLHIKTDKAGLGHMRVFNLKGSLVFEKEVNASGDVLDVSGISPGLYLYELSIDQELIYGRFLLVE